MGAHDIHTEQQDAVRERWSVHMRIDLITPKGYYVLVRELVKAYGKA